MNHQLNAIYRTHPVPWTHLIQLGNVFIVDAAGKQVQLFTALDVLGLVTAEHARATAPAATPA